MSRSALAALAASTTFTCGVIYYVHYSQQRDKLKLREGILIDLDRQQKKAQNILELQRQADLTKMLRQHEREHKEKEGLMTNSNNAS
ncbi:hypothetical protein BsWGS_15121 [Bradybaena similaris]